MSKVRVLHDYTDPSDTDPTLIHLDHPVLDYTLCGDGHSEEFQEVKRGKINCPSCIRIIQYCKRVKAEDMSSTSTKQVR